MKRTSRCVHLSLSYSRKSLKNLSHSLVRVLVEFISSAFNEKGVVWYDCDVFSMKKVWINGRRVVIPSFTRASVASMQSSGKGRHPGEEKHASRYARNDDDDARRMLFYCDDASDVVHAAENIRQASSSSFLAVTCLLSSEISVGFCICACALKME